MRPCSQLLRWGFAFALILAAGVVRDAAAAVILTGRTSQIQISGSANEGGPLGSGGYAYSPPASSSTNFYTTFTDSQSGDATSSPTGSYHAASSAIQTSGVNTGLDDVFSIASGSGSANADFFDMHFPDQAGGGGADANSFFDVFFDVTVNPVPYNLSGTLMRVGPGVGIASVSLSRTDSGGYTIYYADALFTSSFEDTGVLEPGSYELYMTAIAHAGGALGSGSDGGHSSFNATLTVPEPSTLILFGIAAIGLVGYARRRRRN